MEVLAIKLLNLQKELECPVCITLPESRPIYQCENGHIICKSCRKQLETCPQCRTPLGNSRSLAAESCLDALIEPCTFAKHGCDAKLLPHNQEDHKKNCDYRLVPCPVKKCQQTVSFCNVMNHLQSYHGKYVQISGKFSRVLTLECDAVNCYAYKDKHFLIMKTITPNGNWHFWVYGLGSREQIANFFFEISLYNRHGSSKLLSQEPVLSLDKSPEDIIRDKDGLVLTEKAISRLLISGPTSYTVSIGEKF